jgi:hypothetical protein
MASKTSSRSRSVTSSRIAAGRSERSEGKTSERTASNARASRVPLSRRSTLPKKQNSDKAPVKGSRKSRVPTQQQRRRAGPGGGGAGSKTASRDRRVEEPAGKEYFVYKNVQNKNGGEDSFVAMDQGCAKQPFPNVSGVNAYCALALYSWLGRNCQSWGATEVKCELQEGDDTGIARYTYESMVMMQDGERVQLYAEFYGRPATGV